MAQTHIQGSEADTSLPNKADVLEYMADMIAELRDLAQRTDCTTLAGILDAARLEAALQGAAAGHAQKRTTAS